MEQDYKETAFEASQMLSKIASFVRNNKAVDIGSSEKELTDMAEALMEDVRNLYKTTN